MSTEHRTAAERRPPGRPRSERSHLAIVRATLELLTEVGYQRLTMEQVQRRAGVGKATIYRRWDSKAELVKDAIQYVSAELPIPDTGSLRGGLCGARGRRGRDRHRPQRCAADAAAAGRGEP